MNKNKTKGLSGINLLVCVAFMVIMYWFLTQGVGPDQSYSYYDFQKALQNKTVKSVIIEPDKTVPTGTIQIQLKDDTKEELNVSDVTEVEELLQSYNVDYKLRSVPQDNVFMTSVLPALLMLGGILVVFAMMNRQNGGVNAKAMNFGKSRAKMTTENTVNFEKVAGLREEKEDLEEIVDFLRSPEKYTRVGARIPKGVLLEGPPGTR